ncbi:MAG TPA: response regulator [Blastocatellia bacterium]|nr:response regulator [Blastocatellia bacterium]
MGDELRRLTREMMDMRQPSSELHTTDAGEQGTEEALRESRERFRMIVEELVDGYWETDLAGNFTFINDRVAQSYGRSKEEMLRLKPRDYMDEETARKMAAACRQISLSGEPIRGLAYEIIRADGTRRCIEANVSLIRDRSGKPTGFCGLSRDVTARKRLEEALRQSEERYRTIIENMHDAYFEMDLRGALSFFNDALCTLHQRSREELLGKNNREFMDEETAKRMFDIFRQIYETGEPVRDVVWKRTRPDVGDRWFELSASLMRDAQGKGVGYRGISRDITPRILYEAALQNAKEAAERANRAKSEFLANMSHEIRTPMNGIIGMTDLALDTDLTPEQRDYLCTVKTSAHSLLTIINDILDFSKIEAGKLDFDTTDFSLRDCLAEAVKSLAIRAHQKRLELALEVAPDLPDALLGDPVRLRQVVVNLLGNAIKFTEAGEVVVRARTDWQAEGQIGLHLAVSDTGIGIVPDKQQMIFSAFTQADGSTTRQYGGTGLGLAISSQLVGMMGGNIWVESAPGQGSTFHATARLAVQATRPATSPQPAPADLTGLRVLAVDDNATNRRILEQMLGGWGMRPALADGGRAALAEMAMAWQAGQPFALVLLDGQMPGMDGFALAAQIRRSAAFGGATIMMLTSNDQRDDIARCRELGISEYLVKPITQSSLYDAIIKALGAARADAEPARRIEPDAGLARRALRVLLAEDSAVNQKLMTRLLEKRGHTVRLAANGRQAIGALADGGFDVVLMDVQMPEMNGFEATALIRERERAAGGHTPIIALTASALKGDRERCLEAGMDDYLSKPIRKEELFQVIERFTPDSATTGAGLPDAVRPQRPIDLSTFLESLDGDDELAAQLAETFLASSSKYVDEIQEAIAHQDGARLERAAHGLKGSVANFYDETSFRAAQCLEGMGSRRDFTGTAESLAELTHELGHLRSALMSLTVGRSSA